MDEKAELRRRILLKGQAVKLIQTERQELRRKLFLLELRDFYVSQIKEPLDRVVSSKLDAVDFLLSGTENER